MPTIETSHLNIDEIKIDYWKIIVLIFKQMSNTLETLVCQLQRSLSQLTKRVEKLEDENTKLKKWVSREKKKVSVQQWLLNNWTPRTDYITWQQNIKFTQQDLQNVFKHGFAAGAFYAIQRQLPLGLHKSFPIIGFKQRGMVFYVYIEGKWRIMEKHELETLAQHINSQLFVSFTAWENENPGIMDTEEGRKLWNKNLKKILLPPEKQDGIIKKIRNRLFQYLQMDLKNVTEYEFSF